ncbi:hypothetical protein [Singulisphaera sp. PoT]|uniref:hypothetical protein n=1 Tax=Singulisphaera sp. PoT TaxID=3411797 RepID=UPI003BF56C7A
MKVKMLTTLAGPEFTCQAGETCDVPEAMADDLLEGGYAEEVEETAGEPDQADAEQPAPTSSPATTPTASPGNPRPRPRPRP